MTTGTGPLIGLLDPPDCSTIKGTVTVIFNSFGELSTFQFIVDGVDVKGMFQDLNKKAYEPFQWNTKHWVNGLHTYSVRMTDQNGKAIAAYGFIVTISN